MLHFFMPLDRYVILNQAFSILNESGLESLTLRRLAARLGVKAPAIYWHFKNKQELLDEMGTQVLREALDKAPTFDAAQSWQDWALNYCLGLRRTLLGYREGARMFSGRYLTDAALFAPMEASLHKLTSAGFSLRQSELGLSVLYCYVVGFVIEEQARNLAPGVPDPRYDPARRASRVDRQKYPLVHESGQKLFADHDTRFLEGVSLVIVGLTSLLPAASKRD